MKKSPILASLLGLAALLCGIIPSSRGASLESYLKRAPFPMGPLSAPTFPNRSFSIVAYGAVGDGVTVNTGAIARAIEACVHAGGGRVIIPAGLWLTGPIVLKSGVDLQAERGALIQFTADHSEYALVPREGRGFLAESPIHAEGQTHFALTGAGIYDGAGDTWRPVRRSKVSDSDWKALLAKGGVTSGESENWWPTRAAMEGEDFLAHLAQRTKHPTAADELPARDFLRPPLIALTDCQDVLLDGVTLRNSPSGIFSPNRCSNLTVSQVTFSNDWFAQNGDGMDVNNCRNVAIYQCVLSTGDDAICMKAGGVNWASGGAGLQKVVVAECTVYRGHGGFVVGGTTESGMSDLWATQCLFIGTDVGIRVKSGLGHGGVVQHVYADHILMRDIAREAISFNTFYDNAPVSAAAVKTVLSRDPAKTPEFRDFLIQDITCIGADRAISFIGLPQHPIHQVRIERAAISARHGFSAEDAADITLSQVKMTVASGPRVTEKNTARIVWNEGSH